MRFMENNKFKRKEDFFIKIEINEEGYIQFKKINSNNTETLLKLTQENKMYLLQTGNFHNQISVCTYFALTDNDIDYFIYRHDSSEAKKAIKDYYIKTSLLKVGDIFSEDKRNTKYIFLGCYKNDDLKIFPRYYVMEVDNRLIHGIKKLFVTNIEGSDEYFKEKENTKEELERVLRLNIFFNSDHGGILG